MANRWENNGNSERLYVVRLQNHWRWWLQPWNEKMLAPWKKSYDQPRQHIKKQRHFSANKGFSSGHVWMWELDYKESWAPKNWYFWTEVLEKTLESPLDCKEIQPDYPKGNQSWMFLWKDWCWSWNSNTLATWWEELTHLKRPSCWERLRAGGEGDDRGWDGWMASPTQWTWVWVGSGSWWWTRSQRVRHDWVTELTISSFILKLYLFQIRSVGALKAAPESFWPISSISLFAAMTKQYGLDGLSSSRNVFLTSLEAGNSRCWSIWFLMRALFLAHRWPSSLWILMLWKEKSSISFSSSKATSPIGLGSCPHDIT